jgi:putative membrane protein
MGTKTGWVQSKLPRGMNRQSAGMLTGIITLAVISPAWSMSLATTGPAQPRPDQGVATVSLPVAANLVAGSASLIPIVAAELPAQSTRNVDTTAPAGGGDIGKPIDDISFLALAADGGRKELGAAHDALAQLKDPELRRVAEGLIRTHEDANARMARIAEAKSWPLPVRPAHAAPPAGAASADFDAIWTDEMIVTHERLAALYGAQAQGGEDQELRRFARDTLPTLQNHLTELRRLQK